MSDQVLVSSGAEIKRPANSIVRVHSIVNPEKVLVDALADYLRTTGYMEKYPNFSTVRVGVVHPFAILIFQSFQNETLSTDLFPSITVADSSDSRQALVIGQSGEEIVYSAAEVFQVKTCNENGSLFVSDAGIQALETATANGGKVAGVLRRYYMSHNMDFNIWADNRDIVSMLYELVQHFLVEYAEKVAEDARMDYQGQLSGRRSGDVNVEFGSILYGANVTADVGVRSESVEMDVPIGIISEIDVQTYPEYHTVGE